MTSEPAKTDPERCTVCGGQIWSAWHERECLTPRPETLALDAKGVCLIIDACARSKVAVLKFRDLEVTFGLPAHVEAAQAPHTIHSGTPLPESEIKQMHETALNEDAERIREEKIAELIITNPLEYERMMENGELGKEDGDEPNEET